MAIRSKQQLLLAKPEITYGVDAAPTGLLNAMLVSNVKINPLNATEVDRKVVSKNFGSFGKVIGDVHVTIGFDVELAASGTPGVAPSYGPLLKGCALAEVIAPGVSVSYSLVDSGEQSLTLYLIIGGKQRIIRGARGSFKTKMSAKGEPLLSFSFVGLYTTPTDVSFPAADVSAFRAPLCVSPQNTTATLHGYTGVIADFSFDLGVKVSYLPRINAESVQVTDRVTTGSITLEDVPVAVKDFDTICRTGTSGAFVITHGQTAGNRVQISAPAVQLHAMQSSEQDNIEMLQMAMSFNRVVGNDEVVITFS